MAGANPKTQLITSAWLKSNATFYKSFLIDDSTIDQYCATHIEPYQVEIDHLGMHACIDAILKPAGISVEVAYLDRSAGEEMNTFSWQGTPLKGRANLPTVRLLYRPYDRCHCCHPSLRADARQGPLRPSLQTGRLSEHPVAGARGQAVSQDARASSVGQFCELLVVPFGSHGIYPRHFLGKPRRHLVLR